MLFVRVIVTAFLDIVSWGCCCLRAFVYATTPRALGCSFGVALLGLTMLLGLSLVVRSCCSYCSRNPVGMQQWGRGRHFTEVMVVLLRLWERRHRTVVARRWTVHSNAGRLRISKNQIKEHNVCKSIISC